MSDVHHPPRVMDRTPCVGLCYTRGSTGEKEAQERRMRRARKPCVGLCFITRMRLVITLFPPGLEDNKRKDDERKKNEKEVVSSVPRTPVYEYKCHGPVPRSRTLSLVYYVDVDSLSQPPEIRPGSNSCSVSLQVSPLVLLHASFYQFIFYYN